MTVTEKANSCWTKAFQEHIARNILLPKIRSAIHSAERKPHDMNELYKVFSECYEITIKKKYFLECCKLIGLEFETRVEIKTNKMELEMPSPRDATGIDYNDRPLTPQGQRTQFNSQHGGIVG